MTRRGKRDGPRSRRTPPSRDGVACPFPYARAADRLHVLTARHLELFASAARVRPELRELFDLRQFEPGSESIESVSARLHAWLLAAGFDKPVFMVLCELNAERLIADFVRHLDDEGLPFDEYDLLADLYSRLQRFYAARPPPPTDRIEAARLALRPPPPEPIEPTSDSPPEFLAMGRTTTLFAGLVAVARSLVAERVRFLIAASVPLPGTRPVGLAPADSLLGDAARHLAASRHRVKADDLRHWIAYALLSMPALDRKLIQLRGRRELTLADLAKRVGMTRFETGVRLRRAIDSLFVEIDRILTLFEPSDAVAEPRRPERRPPGRLVRFPGGGSGEERTQRGVRPSKDSADEDEDG